MMAKSCAIPLPLSPRVCGVPAALSATSSVACSVPTTDDLNTIVIVQFDDGASEVVQFVVGEKSDALAPFTLREIAASGAVPVLVSVTVCDEAVIPSICGENWRLVAEKVAIGAIAVPLNATIAGPPVVGTIWNDPVCAPAVPG